MKTIPQDTFKLATYKFQGSDHQLAIFLNMAFPNVYSEDYK